MTYLRSIYGGICDVGQTIAGLTYRNNNGSIDVEYILPSVSDGLLRWTM
jgi:hypothetical protein